MHATSLFLFWTLAALQKHVKCISDPAAQCVEITEYEKAEESLLPSGLAELAVQTTNSREPSRSEASVLEQAAHTAVITVSSKNHSEKRNTSHSELRYKNHTEKRNTSHSELRYKNHSEQQKQNVTQWNLQLDRMRHLWRRDGWAFTLDIRWLLLAFVVFVLAVVGWLYTTRASEQPTYEDRFEGPSEDRFEPCTPQSTPYTQRRFDEAMKDRRDNTTSRRRGDGTPAARGAGFTPKAGGFTPKVGGGRSPPSYFSGGVPREVPGTIVEEKAEFRGKG